MHRQLTHDAVTPVVALLYWPAGQSTHTSRAAALYSPASHAVHCAVPLVGATLPAAHSWQVVWPVPVA